MRRFTARSRATSATAICVALLTLAACDHDPTGLQEATVEARAQTLAAATIAEDDGAARDAGIDAANSELIRSEIARLDVVLGSVPHAALLQDALVRLADADGADATLAAARLVIRSMDNVARADDAGDIVPELDAVRLLLDALTFVAPVTDEHSADITRTAPTLVVW